MQLRRRGLSLRRLSLQHGLSPSTLRVGLTRGTPRALAIIRAAIREHQVI